MSFRMLSIPREKRRLPRARYGRHVVGLVAGAALLLCLSIEAATLGWRSLALALAAGIAVPGLAVIVQTVRRLHDRGRSGWWLAPALAILAGSLAPIEDAFADHPVLVTGYALASSGYLLWLAVETLGRPGESGPNRYGPPAE